MNRRAFLARSALTLGASAIGCFAYATEEEPHWLEIVERELAIENLPRALAGAKLAQLSDLHVGPQVADEYIVHTFDRLRALAPDIVVITGDFISHRASRGEAQFAQLRSVLTHLPHGRLATLGILGNHDYGHGWGDLGVADRVTTEGERAGVRMLRNESQAVAGLDFVGVDDLWAHRGYPAKALECRESNAALVLVHNPDSIYFAKTWLFGLLVFGSFFSYEVCRKLDPNALPILRTYRYMYGTTGSFALVAVSTGIAAASAWKLGLQPLLWPASISLILSYFLFVKGRFKIVEGVASLSLTLHIWAVALASLFLKGWIR